jgi:hypothetical protein
MSRETGRTGYKVKLKAKLREMFPGCIIQHQDPNVIHQGIPDLLIIFGDRWGMLEAKASATSVKQPNQEYWIDFYNEQSFASFIYPENEEEVLNALSRSLAPRQRPRNSKREQ